MRCGIHKGGHGLEVLLGLIAGSCITQDIVSLFLLHIEISLFQVWITSARA